MNRPEALALTWEVVVSIWVLIMEVSMVLRGLRSGLEVLDRAYCAGSGCACSGYDSWNESPKWS